jgi:4-oxalocrotonate tautomerase
MPILKVELFSGRSHEVRDLLAQRLTEVITDVLGTAPEDVSVIVSEVQPRDWFVGGRSYAARQSGNHGE